MHRLIPRVLATMLTLSAAHCVDPAIVERGLESDRPMSPLETPKDGPSSKEAPPSGLEF